jgi:hypothetical protein
MGRGRGKQGEERGLKPPGVEVQVQFQVQNEHDLTALYSRHKGLFEWGFFS